MHPNIDGFSEILALQQHMKLIKDSKDSKFIASL